MNSLINHTQKIVSDFYQFIRKHFSIVEAIIHFSIAFLIIIQILDSYFIHNNHQTYTLGVGTWFHLIVGCMLTFLIIIFLIMLFRKRGFKYYFPYLFGHFSVLFYDLKLLFKFRLPQSKPYGLASIIQGLGLCALLAVLLSGFLWLIAFKLNFQDEESLKHLHKFLTTFIEIYIFAHGAMAIFHFLIEKYFPNYIEKIKA